MTLRRKNVTKNVFSEKSHPSSCVVCVTLPTHHMYFYGKRKGKKLPDPNQRYFPHLMPCGHETCAKNVEAVLSLDVTPQRAAHAYAGDVCWIWANLWCRSSVYNFFFVNVPYIAQNETRGTNATGRECRRVCRACKQPKIFPSHPDLIHFPMRHLVILIFILYSTI